MGKKKVFIRGFFIDNIESCNCILKTSAYKSVRGMNENLYIGEDSDLSYRINNHFGKNKMFFSGKCVIFHKDRNLKRLILQRFAWGMYMDVEIKSAISFNKILFLMPMLILLLGISLTVLSFWSLNFFLIMLSIIIVFAFLIFIDLSKFKISLFKKSICTIIILIANISYGFGSLLCFTKIHKIIGKYIYRKS